MALVRSAQQVCKEIRRLPALWQSGRNLTIEIDKFKDKETAEEAVFFSKQDEKLLRSLLKKVKKQADVADKHEAVGEEASELSRLTQIVGKYNMSKADLEALIHWKHGL